MHIPGTFFARDSRFGCRTSTTRHQYLKCIQGVYTNRLVLYFLFWFFNHSSFTYFVSGNVLNTTPIGAWYKSDKISSSRADQGPFSVELNDMFSKEFRHLNFASNISNVSLCFTTLMMRVPSLCLHFLHQMLTAEHPAMLIRH